MQYRIIGQTVPAVEVMLNVGEAMYTQSGGMIWQTPGIEMKTNTRGGLGKGLGRLFAGESLFMTTYSATQPNARITFGSTVPGSVLPVQISSVPLIVQKGAFLCAENSVEAAITFTKKLSVGLFGGEGFILQRLTGSGMAFLEIDGDMVEYTLAPGETLLVDTGNVVAFDESVGYEIQTVKGVANVLFGGEGLFLTKLVGPGKIVLQTQNFNDFAGKIIARIPSSK